LSRNEEQFQARLDALAELPFDRGLQDPEAVTNGDFPTPMTDLAESVGEFLDSDDAGPVAVPESALDVRGLPPRIRHEQVGEEFRALDPGEEFYVVNDHDASPLAEMLAGEFTDESEEGASATEAFERCEVHRRGPDEWVLEVKRAV
jgi:ATP-binding protein involved in chromosome partitioning